MNTSEEYNHHIRVDKTELPVSVSECPEADLLCEVVLQAIRELDSVNHKIREEARLWLLGRQAAWYMSLLGIENPSYVVRCALEKRQLSLARRPSLMPPKANARPVQKNKSCKCFCLKKSATM